LGHLLNVILKIDKPGKMMVAGISLALIAMVILYYDSAKDLLKEEYLIRYYCYSDCEYFLGTG
jgi:hypothetical protein